MAGFFDWARGKLGLGSQERAAPDMYSPEALGPTGIAVTGALPYGMPPPRGARELAVAGKREPWLFAVTDKIARSVAAVNWHLGASYDKGGYPDAYRARMYNRLRAQVTNTYEPGRRRSRWMRDLRREMKVEAIYNHPLLDLFDKPNPLQTGVQFRTLLQRHMDLAGELFNVKERNAHGMPVQLWPVPGFWCRLTPYYGRNTFMFSYGMFLKELPDTEVVWHKHLDIENPYARGFGPGFALADVIETYAYALKTEKAFYYNQGMPPVVVGLENSSDEQLKKIRETWEQRNGGFWNAMKIAWVNTKLSIAKLAPKFADAQMLEQQNQKRDTIIQIYGVPPEILGITDHSNKATAVAAKGIFAAEVLVPRLEDQREVWNQQLVPEFDESLILEYTSPVPDDREQDISVFQKVPTVLTNNEWRALGNQDPDPDDEWGNQHYVLPAPAPQPGAPAEPADAGTAGGADEEPAPKALDPKKPARHAVVEARAVRALSQDDVDGILSVLDNSGDLDSIAEAVEECVQDFGDEFLRQIADSYDSGDVPDAFDMTNEAVVDYLKNSSAERIKDISDTTREYLRDYLSGAVSDGLSIDDMVDGLESDTNDAFGDARAETIARTEVLSASNFGTLQGYKQSGVVEKKGWMATPGTKGSRESHEALDGTVVGIDEEFTDSATGATGQHPGGFGDPSSDCNCRCCVYAVVDDPGETEGLRKQVEVKATYAKVVRMRRPHEDHTRKIAAKALTAQRDAVVKALRAKAA